MKVRKNLRNIAIIAHVDHGKTTLVDKLLGQSGTLVSRGEATERVMDSNDLEKERGITILSKNTSITWKDHLINIVDTPGHSDFGGEVERILSMVDSVLLLVDAAEGPMPQTKFVTQKAFQAGLNPIVVINKIDRQGARPDWALDQVFDLFDRLGATEEQLDFPVIFASALQGISGLEHENMGDDMTALFEAIIEKVPAPNCDLEGPFQMQVTSLDYSSYVGSIAIGRVTRGSINKGTAIKVINPNGKIRQEKILQILGYKGLERLEQDKALAGDIIAVTGVNAPKISETLCDFETVEALPPLIVDEPTVQMIMQVNNSPFAGKEGKFLTSRRIKERLEHELLTNVALKVEPLDDPDKFRLCGRGELHLSVLLETMRREGFEMAISKPTVIFKEIDGVKQEPYESLSLDLEEKHQGTILEYLNSRKGEMTSLLADSNGRVRVEYTIPTRGLIGFHQRFMTMTSGSGLSTHIFSHYDKCKEGASVQRKNGTMISNAAGKATAYALWNLQARGKILINPQTQVYEGMIIGEHSRDNDIVVNVIRGKQLTNVRASGSDDNIVLTPPPKMSLEQAIEFINDDELVELTPESIRFRKKNLKESDRKRKK